jgi:hypothetical protein
MKTAKLALVLLALACSFALGQPAPDHTTDRSQILASIAEISRAYVARDAAPFERLYLEGHASIRSKPTYNLREQLIAMMQADSFLLRAGKKLDYETVRYETEAPKVSFYGRTAIVNVAKKNYWQYRGQKCQTRTQATEVWVKPDEEWKIAAGHTTTFQCDPKPFHPIHAAVATMQSRTRPPANADFEAEQQIRELIKILVAARASLDEPFEAVVDRYTADTFVSTDLKGEVGRDRSILATIQMPLPSRAAGFRNQEDSVLIYGDAAVYTYRIRGSAETAAAEGPQQSTIVFARTGGRWMIVAAHISKQSID